ncbi:MAG TPA: hypothetical protein VJ547_07770 [Candidatus Thermoplasmatota archaeon]|nr:hypothetical protein [Candidatus Thermoplasmatota archaeon]
MPPPDALDESEERLLAYIKSYDFEKYGWNTAEAAADLGMTTAQVYQGLSKIQKLKRAELFLYYKDGALHVQTA